MLPKNSRQGLGRRGEDLAAGYLASQGYQVLERNARTLSGEIDLVTLHGDTLVLVEVRTRRGDAYGTAAESIGPAKQAKLRTVCAEYWQAHPNLAAGCRIDVVTVELGRDGRLLKLEVIQGAVGGE